MNKLDILSWTINFSFLAVATVLLIGICYQVSNTLVVQGTPTTGFNPGGPICCPAIYPSWQNVIVIFIAIILFALIIITIILFAPITKSIKQKVKRRKR